MRQWVTLFLSTTSSQDIFLHLWVLNFQTCPTALQLCPSVGLTMLHPRESVIWADDFTHAFTNWWWCALSWYAVARCGLHKSIHWKMMMCAEFSWSDHLVSTCINLHQLVSTCINWYQLVSTCIIWWCTGFICVHAKGARARWCPDHRFRWFDWDHWILPGSFHHGRTRSTWGSVRHEGLHWDWWARQLWRWLPQLLGQGGGPWGPQEQACGRVGQRKAGYDGHHRNVFPGAMLKKHLQLHKHRHELRTSRIAYLISIVYGRWCHNSTS